MGGGHLPESACPCGGAIADGGGDLQHRRANAPSARHAPPRRVATERLLRALGERAGRHARAFRGGEEGRGVGGKDSARWRWPRKRSLPHGL